MKIHITIEVSKDDMKERYEDEHGCRDELHQIVVGHMDDICDNEVKSWVEE